MKILKIVFLSTALFVVRAYAADLAESSCVAETAAAEKSQVGSFWVSYDEEIFATKRSGLDTITIVGEADGYLQVKYEESPYVELAAAARGEEQVELKLLIVLDHETGQQYLTFYYEDLSSFSLRRAMLLTDSTVWQPMSSGMVQSISFQSNPKAITWTMAPTSDGSRFYTIQL